MKNSTRPAPREARKSWKDEALEFQALLEKAREEVFEINQRHRREVDSMKARVFDATSTQSPWIKQNNAVRRLIQTYLLAAPPHTPGVIRDIAAILDGKVPT